MLSLRYHHQNAGESSQTRFDKEGNHPKAFLNGSTVGDSAYISPPDSLATDLMRRDARIGDDVEGWVFRAAASFDDSSDGISIDDA
jgi:hypothetical protein